MVGIDTLNTKLITYSRALKHILPQNCKWLIIRDTDCVPFNRKEEAGNDDKKNMDVENVKVLFQEGFGLESTFASEPSKLARMLTSYYNLPLSDTEKVLQQINDVSLDYINKVKNVTNKEIHEEFEKHFIRQKNSRISHIYKNLKVSDVLSNIEIDNIQYILTKKIMNQYLSEIHNHLQNVFGTLNKKCLTEKTIFDFYYSWISSTDDFFLCHKVILDEIYS